MQAAIGAAAAGVTAHSRLPGSAQQTTADAQRASTEAQQKWNATTQQAQNTMNQAQATTTSVYQQATTAATQAEQRHVATGQQTADRTQRRRPAIGTTSDSRHSTNDNTANQWENQPRAPCNSTNSNLRPLSAGPRSRDTGRPADGDDKQQWQTTACKPAQDANPRPRI